jgi:exportin-2 (importin alpha re-exporter)
LILDIIALPISCMLRLQQSRTHKFVRSFLVFLALFIIKHGPPATMASIDKVQPGVFMMLLQQVCKLCV